MKISVKKMEIPTKTFNDVLYYPSWGYSSTLPGGTWSTTGYETFEVSTKSVVFINYSFVLQEPTDYTGIKFRWLLNDTVQQTFDVKSNYYSITSAPVVTQKDGPDLTLTLQVYSPIEQQFVIDNIINTVAIMPVLEDQFGRSPKRVRGAVRAAR